MLMSSLLQKNRQTCPANSLDADEFIANPRVVAGLRTKDLSPVTLSLPH